MMLLRSPAIGCWVAISSRHWSSSWNRFMSIMSIFQNHLPGRLQVPSPEGVQRLGNGLLRHAPQNEEIAL